MPRTTKRDQFAALRAENARLREALRELVEASFIFQGGRPDKADRNVLRSVRELARAVLKDVETNGETT